MARQVRERQAAPDRADEVKTAATAAAIAADGALALLPGKVIFRSLRGHEAVNRSRAAGQARSGPPPSGVRASARSDAARRIRVDLVAAGDPRDAVAGGQQQVEERGREPQRALDPAPARELAGGAEGHRADRL